MLGLLENIKPEVLKRLEKVAQEIGGSLEEAAVFVLSGDSRIITDADGVALVWEKSGEKIFSCNDSRITEGANGDMRWECEALKAAEKGLPEATQKAMTDELKDKVRKEQSRELKMLSLFKKATEALGDAETWEEGMVKEYALRQRMLEGDEEEMKYREEIADAMKKRYEENKCGMDEVVKAFAQVVSLMGSMTIRITRIIEIENMMKEKGLEIVRKEDGSYGYNALRASTPTQDGAKAKGKGQGSGAKRVVEKSAGKDGAKRLVEKSAGKDGAKRVVEKSAGKATMVFVLTGKWWDEIAAGLKRVEYRKITPYWKARIEKLKAGDVIEFRRGYTDREVLRAEVIAWCKGRCPYEGWSGKYYCVSFKNVEMKG